MTPYEFLYILGEPFLPVLRGKVRSDIIRLIRNFSHPVELLDVGGRKSPYTIGVKANVTVTDVPRETEVQIKLNLGFTEDIREHLQKNRSNIAHVIVDDMTQSNFPSDSFDIIIAIEVIEHVPNDSAFISEIYRVLKPDGFVYLTTPNGDYIRNEPPNYNPDHVRHYQREQLADLLNEHFRSVTVTYGVRTGKYRVIGLKPLNTRNPIHTLETLLSNVINRWESKGVEQQPKRTAHLFAIAQK